MTIVPSSLQPDEADDQLVLSLAAGDEKAFRTLYRRHTPRLRGLVRRLLGGHDADTDDALQESWIRAVAGVQQFRGDSAFATWLNGIGVRVAWEIVRRRSIATTMSPEDEPAIDPPDNGERLDLEQALARLPDDQRLVVVLHDVEGYGHEAIAESLGVAVSTSRSHLFRARRALRAMLSSYERILK